MDDKANNIIEVQRLRKEYVQQAGYFARKDKTTLAVQDVSFEVRRGESYGLLGLSGSGKTTTARMIIQMIKPTAGVITYYGNNSILKVTDCTEGQLKEYREHVKYIFQDPAKSLNPRMSVGEILTIAQKDKRAAHKKAAQVIEQVGLPASTLRKRPMDFSGGQRQRISIARALMGSADLLICDEVVSALDVSIQGQIINLLVDLKRSRGLSYIFITHDIGVADYFCDRIGVMKNGQLVEERVCG